MDIDEETVQRLSKTLRSVKVIGFDLDDTLWDNRAVITTAIDAQFQFLERQLPKLTRTELEACFSNKVMSLIEGDPVRYQDISLLRKEALNLLCHYFDLPDSSAVSAYRAFYQARQNFSLFKATEPLLELLQSKFTLVAISNGNASLAETSIEDFFRFHWRAGRNGKAKPSGDMLVKACERLSIRTNELLYVGDHIEYDYLAARNAGAYSVIINDLTGQSLKLSGDRYEFSNLEKFLNAVKMCMPL